MNTKTHNYEDVSPASKASADGDKRLCPCLIMLIGIPGSGKSHWAQQYVSENPDTVIVSSDAVRSELFGDESDQSDNSRVFQVVHSRIKHLLQEGISVIFDATNIDKKRRIAFLAELKNITCRRIAAAIMTPFDICVQRNSLRTRKVPESVIRRMYLNWQPPFEGEGFDEAYFLNGCEDHYLKKYTLGNLVDDSDNFMNLDQENFHHSRTLGKHCLAAAMRIAVRYPDNYRLFVAAFLHDIGKAFTKSRLNHKGVDDGNCHYYQHHCVSAYDSAFYTGNAALCMEDRIYVANLIYYHMHPHRQWKDSENARRRDAEYMSGMLKRDVMLLHRADLAAQ